MSDHICCEIQYDGIHSDLCGSNLHDPEWRKVVHSALDEWMDKSNGSGCFYIGNVLEMVVDYLDKKKLLNSFAMDARLTITTMEQAISGGDYDYAKTKVRDLIKLSEKMLRLELDS